MRDRWHRTWPSLLAVVTVAAVGGPAAIASWRHARDVIAANGDPVMAGWLALTTDGMLVAALVVIWVRRHRGERAGRGPLGAFWAGMAATLGANLAAAMPTFIGFVVALWPPVCLAITLELVALVAARTARTTDQTDRAEPTGQTGQTDRAGTVGQAVADRAAGPIPDRADEAVPDRAEAGQPTGQETGQTGQTDRADPTDPRPGAARSGQQEPKLTANDAQVLAWLRDRAEETGQVPGRDEMLARYRMGSGRADRIRGQVTVPKPLRRVK